MFEHFNPLRIVTRHFYRLTNYPWSPAWWAAVLVHVAPPLAAAASVWFLTADLKAPSVGLEGDAYLDALRAEMGVLALFSAFFLNILGLIYTQLRQANQEIREAEGDEVVFSKEERSRLSRLGDNVVFAFGLTIMTIVIAAFQFITWPEPVQRLLLAVNAGLVGLLLMTLLLCFQRFHFMVCHEADRLYPEINETRPKPKIVSQKRTVG